MSLIYFSRENISLLKCALSKSHAFHRMQEEMALRASEKRQSLSAQHHEAVDDLVDRKIEEVQLDPFARRPTRSKLVLPVGKKAEEGQAKPAAAQVE